MVGARAPKPLCNFVHPSNLMCLAAPGKVLTITGDDPLLRTGRISFGSLVEEVNLACVPEAPIGDCVIVHVGFAISVLDETEAHRVFDYLREIGELEELKPSP